MKALVCQNCGATGLQRKSGYWICEYCGSRFLVTNEDLPSCGSVPSARPATGSSSISLDSDIEMLLQKCRATPRNARKYANLILDIDPDNTEALKYL